MATDSTSLQLELIKAEKALQPRAGTIKETIDEYAEAMLEGSSFPPLTVFFDGADYWLADGFHRYYAYKQIEAREVSVEVKEGSRRDAVLYSVGANATHGLRRSNEDKRRAVTTLLEDGEWQRWSDREIARQCSVDHKFVGKIRSGLSGDIPRYEYPDERKVQRKGKTYIQNTANIGKTQTEALEPAKPLPVIPTSLPRILEQPQEKKYGLQEDGTYLYPKLEEPQRVKNMREAFRKEKELSDMQTGSPLYHEVAEAVEKIYDLGVTTIKEALETPESKRFAAGGCDLRDNIRDAISILQAVLNDSEVNKHTITVQQPILDLKN